MAIVAAGIFTTSAVAPANATETWSRGYDECNSSISIHSYTLGPTFHSYTPYPISAPAVKYKGVGYDTHFITNTGRTRLTNMGVSAEDQIYAAWPSC